MEEVDILLPPTFIKSGKTKTLQKAWNDEDWIGTFNLWVIQNTPFPSIIYQIRSPNSSWAPNKLDVTAGGHYDAGEKIVDGLREVREELGRNYPAGNLTYLGRKINISPDTKGRTRKNIVEVFFILDNSPLGSYKLQKSEVYAICSCPIEKLIKVHLKKGYKFIVEGINSNKEKIKIRITKDSFPYNWDNYHLKIALLADRFFKGERNLIY